MTFTVLTVCTGNICRSPVAERLISAELAAVGDVRVGSAGTGALVGAAAPEPAARIADENHIDLSGHIARQIAEPLLRGADLVLTMTRDHRRIVAETAPSAMRRSFTLRELARLAEALEPQLPEAVAASGATTVDDRMRAAVALATTMRGTVAPPDAPEDLDVIDPYRRPDEIYRESFDQLIPAARRVSAFLTSAAEMGASAADR